MKFLQDPNIKQYFLHDTACVLKDQSDNQDIPCNWTMGGRILDSMQVQINAGDYILTNEVTGWRFGVAKFNINVEYHPNVLRLPDYFQPKKNKCLHAENMWCSSCLPARPESKECEHPWIKTWRDENNFVRCSECKQILKGPSNPKPDAVEEKMESINGELEELSKVAQRMGAVVYTHTIKGALRELVDLVREEERKK